jgi:hypothetical protein
LPAPLGFALAAVLEVEQDQLDVPHQVSLEIRNNHGPIGQAMGGFQSGSQARLEVGESILAPFAMPLHGLLTETYGKHTLTISVDAGVATESLDFWVLHPDEMNIPPVQLGV